MSVTAAAGFQAAGLAAGLKSNGQSDLALVVNAGPDFAAAGVFTTNRVKAAPVVWSQQVLADGRLQAVVLNSGGANACTGPEGFADTHRTAELVAEAVLSPARGCRRHRGCGLLHRADRRPAADGQGDLGHRGAGPAAQPRPAVWPRPRRS